MEDESGFSSKVLGTSNQSFVPLSVSLKSGFKTFKKGGIVKGEWDRSEVEYLGYILGTDSIQMNPKKLSIVNWPESTSVKELQSFLGLLIFIAVLLTIIHLSPLL